MKEKGQTIINVNGDYVEEKKVDYEVGYVAEGAVGIQIINHGAPVKDDSVEEDEQPPTPPTESSQSEDQELSVGDFDLHLQLLKDAMITVQDIPY